jgi:hypothetical protein
MMKKIFTFTLLLYVVACSSPTPPPQPPRPLDIVGKWEVNGTTCNSSINPDATNAMMLLEFGAHWTFNGNGQFKEEFKRKSNLGEEIVANYRWDKDQQQLTITGNYNNFYDIQYHTNDSMALVNIENGIHYEFKRLEFMKAASQLEASLIPPAINLDTIPFTGVWKLSSIQHQQMSGYALDKIKEGAKEQVWTFSKPSTFTLRMGGKTARGKWLHEHRTQKLLIQLGDKTLNYRVVSLAQKLFVVESVESGIKLVFKREGK